MDDKMTDDFYEIEEALRMAEKVGEETKTPTPWQFNTLMQVRRAKESLEYLKIFRQAPEAPKALSKIFCDRCGEVCKPQSNWGNCTLCGDNICENCIPQGFDDAGCCGTCGEHKEAPKTESIQSTLLKDNEVDCDCDYHKACRGEKAESIRDAYESGYIRGHDDTVEGRAIDARIAADEYAESTAPKAESVPMCGDVICARGKACGYWDGCEAPFKSHDPKAESQSAEAIIRDALDYMGCRMDHDSAEDPCPICKKVDDAQVALAQLIRSTLEAAAERVKLERWCTGGSWDMAIKTAVKAILEPLN